MGGSTQRRHYPDALAAAYPAGVTGSLGARQADSLTRIDGFHSI